MTMKNIIYDQLFLFALAICFTVLNGCRNEHETKSGSKNSMENQIDGIKYDPNLYYEGCISCVLATKEEGSQKNDVIIKMILKNKTNYPIPIENRHVFISMKNKINVMEWAAFESYKEGNEVPYCGISIDREPSKFPHDYYIIPGHKEYIAEINISKYYNISVKGEYTIKYYVLNSYTDFLEEGFYFKIESDIMKFRKD